MSDAERQLLLLLADAVRCMALNGTNVGALLPLIDGARNRLDAEAHAADGTLQTAARRDLDPDISRRMAAEARQSALQASQGPDGIDDPHGAIRTASDAPTPSSGHQHNA